MGTIVLGDDMAIDYREMGHRLQDRRKERRLTQEEVAERVDITVVYLSKIENGRAKPTLELLDSLCDVLDLELACLMSGVQTQGQDYANERVVTLFRRCSPPIKQAALDILERLGEL